MGKSSKPRRCYFLKTTRKACRCSTAGDGVIQFAGLSYNGKVTEDGKSVEREIYIMAGLSGAPQRHQLCLDGTRVLLKFPALAAPASSRSKSAI